MTGLSRAAQEVGGDFYDVLDLGQGRLGVAIGDAAGKGLPAALLMAATIGHLRSEAHREASPGRVLTRINHLLCGTIPAGLFVSLLYMVVDTTRGSCVFSSAGHIDPLVLGPGEGRAEFLPVSSLPLGFDPATRYREQKIALGPGHKIILYTDGIIEARNEARSFFGFTGLAGAAARLAGEQKGEALANGLCQEVQRFTAGREQEDDLTVVIIEAPEGGVPWRRILREQSNL
ncbi:MAG: phosphoserine phosphatase RsbU/P [Clostridia bacterium]|nr:phosphoserine phosphatase RsbU/P [Clostridia bacterium]